MKAIRAPIFTAALLAGAVHAQQREPDLDAALPALAEAEAPALLETLRALTAVDSGTGQAAGMAAVADVVERFVKPLGGEVRRVAPANNVAGPNVVVTFRGTGTRKVMLMSHMDTVYVAGTAAAKPFRIDGNRAIAPGIADDKGGIAVFLHAVKLLKARGFNDYERITMVFNSDEERGSSGSRDLIRAQAQEHDGVLSGEPTGPREGLVLGTSAAGGISARAGVGGQGARPIEELADVVLRSRDAFRGLAETRMSWTVMRAEHPAGVQKLAAADSQFATLTWRVKGRASHAGVAPEAGVNAVVEVASLVRRVSEAAAAMPAVTIHWRSASGGLVSNIIPERGAAVLEVAVPKGDDAAAVASALTRVGNQPSVPGAEVVSELAQGVAEPASGGEAVVSADVRVPHAEAFATLQKAVRERIDAKKFAGSEITIREGLGFPAFNATPEGKALAEHAVQIYARLGGSLQIAPRTWGATDSVWAGQSGKPVVEGMGLPGGNYHSSEDEYVLIDRIPRRLTLVAEMIRAIARKP